MGSLIHHIMIVNCTLSRTVGGYWTGVKPLMHCEELSYLYVSSFYLQLRPIYYTGLQSI